MLPPSPRWHHNRLVQIVVQPPVLANKRTISPDRDRHGQVGLRRQCRLKNALDCNIARLRVKRRILLALLAVVHRHSPPKDTAMIEQRRYERKAFYCDLQLTVLPNGSLVNGRAFDISVGGVGIVCDVPLNRGVRRQLLFPLNDN